jgi:hypothetical protein
MLFFSSENRSTRFLDKVALANTTANARIDEAQDVFGDIHKSAPLKMFFPHSTLIILSNMMDISFFSGTSSSFIRPILVGSLLNAKLLFEIIFSFERQFVFHSSWLTIISLSAFNAISIGKTTLRLCSTS